ncbi:MAG: lysine exporter LysO family protein [Firmicutes bacterium]|nr:lysine exporter LysO family protein [Bacillota bacterium]
MTIIILLALAVGILFGYGGLIPDLVLGNIDFLITFTLCFLVASIGLEFGGNRKILSQIQSLGYQVIFLPLAVAMGSIVGSILLGFFLGVPAGESAAIGAGFGWYSFSGVLLTKLHSIELGTLAFLTNVSREVLSLLLTSTVARYGGPYAAVAPGGATTMDVTLPLIVRYAGLDMALVAFINGLVLTILVPILIPLLV